MNNVITCAQFVKISKNVQNANMNKLIYPLNKILVIAVKGKHLILTLISVKIAQEVV